MKKQNILFACAVLALAASCTTTTFTSSTTNVSSQILSATVADLDVAPERVSYTFLPKAEVRRGGKANVRRAAEQYALNEYAKKSGKLCDLLVEPEYVFEEVNNVFSKKVISVKVSGRPATYQKFRSLDDATWCNSSVQSQK
ncbi:MAG: hypothetical protein K2I99_00740 [Bacteroidaceae bacterium]|nr:hypothetical protein [Bacteroidaceae bacterium]